MAFKVWIDDDKVTSTNVLSASDFSTNTERQSGFQANSAASAKNVNSAVRQANLIAVALMESMGITSLNLTSSVNDVKTAIDTYFTNAFAKKLDTTGDAKNAKVTFTTGSTGQLTSGNSLSNLFGTLAAWCASFGNLAKKSIVDTQDVKDGAITTKKFNSNAKAPKSSLSNDWQDISQWSGLSGLCLIYVRVRYVVSGSKTYVSDGTGIIDFDIFGAGYNNVYQLNLANSLTFTLEHPGGYVPSATYQGTYTAEIIMEKYKQLT